MKVKLKSTDNLAPIRNQMMDLIEPESKVIEFGCGNGDLLIELSQKIKYELGIDRSKTIIDRALKQKERMKITNIDFICEELGNNYRNSATYDVSIASLFFHVIPISQAIYLLNKMCELSDTVLACGFSRPVTLKEKALLWLDQRFSGHFGNFKAYQKQGYLEGILADAQFSNRAIYDTHIPFVKIYEINTT